EKVDAGDFENAHNSIAEMYGMIDDGGEVKGHGITTGEDGKKRFYADVEKGGKVTRHDYTPEEFRSMAARMASPDMIQHDIAAADTAWKKRQDERKVAADEKKAGAAERQAGAAERRADVAETNAESLAGLRGSQANLADRKADGSVGGRGGAGGAGGVFKYKFDSFVENMKDDSKYEGKEEQLRKDALEFASGRKSNIVSDDTKQRWVTQAVQADEKAKGRAFKPEEKAKARADYEKIYGLGAGGSAAGINKPESKPAAGGAGWSAVKTK
ncbi:MAG: hypothetical protein WCI73_18025, partial [Phycisphaerae bacterium]